MKISIITFHNTSNFGATLQCLALYSYLSDLGHEVCVVNYLPSFVLEKKSVVKEIKKIKKSNNKVKATVKGLAYLFHSADLRKRDRSFESFISKYIKTTQKYNTAEEIVSNPPICDLYICGSDQIWNPSLTGNTFDKAFFLQFAKGEKVAYGASVGELNILDHREELKMLTRDFSFISMREKSSAVIMSEVLERKVASVLDCTLLLDKVDYVKYEIPIKSINHPYLLLYNIQNSDVSSAIAHKIAKKKGLKIIDISPNPFAKMKDADKYINIGPGEFLYLFHNADYVVTNSFHGTVFSVVFNKQFIVIPHSTRSSRVINLLETLGLKERIAYESGYADPGIIDYLAVYSKLKEGQLTSFNFIRGFLGESFIEKTINKDDSTDLLLGTDTKNDYPLLVQQRVNCCGCGACMNICSRHAIEMIEDKEGFKYPIINQELCVKCYMCVQACIFKKDMGL